MNENISVVQKPQGTMSQARSKSWNGMLAKIARQLSMEGRLKRSREGGKTEELTLSGWSNQGKEVPRAALRAWWRPKKKHDKTSGSDIGSGNRNEMNGVVHGRGDDHVEEGKDSRGTVPQTDYAGMGSFLGNNKTGVMGNGFGSGRRKVWVFLFFEHLFDSIG